MSRYIVKWIVDKENDNIPFQAWVKNTIPRCNKPDEPYIVLEAVIDTVDGIQDGIYGYPLFNDVFKIYYQFSKILLTTRVHDNFVLSENNFNYENRTSLYFDVEDCEEQDNGEKETGYPIQKRLKAINENT